MAGYPTEAEVLAALKRVLDPDRRQDVVTLGMVQGFGLGDPDALVPGDVHLPDVVCFALARESRGSDARMLELLAPFEGHRFRVVRLLSAAGLTTAPRRR